MSRELKTQLAESPTSLPLWLPRAPSLGRALGIVVACLVVQALFAERRVGSGDANLALAQSLASDYALSASPSDVYWVDGRPPWWNPWSTGRAWVLGAHPEGLDDVYLVEARRTPEGSLLDIQAVHNVTQTKATAERGLTADGAEAAWLSGTEQELLRLSWAQLGVDQFAAPNAPALTRRQRLQWRLTWYQESGDWNGLSRRQFKLIPPAKAAHLAFSEGDLVVSTSNGSARLSPGESTMTGQHVAEQVHGLAKPGNVVTWAVDRLRGTPWFGDENMQRLKAVVYRVWDAASRRFGIGINPEESEMTWARPPSTISASPVAPQDSPEGLQRPWPPAALSPLLSPAEPQEGQWLSLNDDPFIKPSSDPNGTFFTTFLRTDAERTYSRIIITLWDPLTVALHTMSGTEEPKSATGETGPGLVPRTPAVIENLVGAFNGGFQSTHGDFGMMADGVVYVPPLPFGATVATDRDGNVGFGTWPESEAVPTSIVGLRQNLTPLVAGGQFNPYQRTWWGGVPSGWEDDTRTVRSGLCLTNDGLVAYFYGAKVDAENLAKAMLAAKCSYGLHLDMNQGHTGLEFYHVAPESELPPLALTLDGVWQAEGPVLEAPGLAFRGRRMFRAMQLMNFPRYIQRETRDFFYLSRRVLLPRGKGERKWAVPAVAGRVYPPAVAVRSVSPLSEPGMLVQMLELAPEFLQPTSAPGSADLVVAALDMPQSPTGEALFWNEGRLVFAVSAPSAKAVALMSTVNSANATAMACVRPETGSLVYAEIASSRDVSRQREALKRLLEEEGCDLASVRQVSNGAFELEGKDLNGHPVEGGSPRTSLVYRRPKRTFELFARTPIVGPSHWRPLQVKPE